MAKSFQARPLRHSPRLPRERWCPTIQTRLRPAEFEAPAVMRRGASAATYRFPQLPAIEWRVDDLGCEEFAAAVAQERGPIFSTLTDLAYDLRNHGWNSASSMQNHNLPTLVHDHDVTMEATDAHYGEKPKVGVFHSISAPTPHCRTRTSPRSTSATFSPSTTTSCPNPRTCCSLNRRGGAPRWCGSSSRKWRTPEHRRVQPRFRSPPDGPAQCCWP